MELHSFPPFLGQDTAILILGSFPSKESRKQGFYYMHPSNRFYKVLSALFNIDFVNITIEDKKELLNHYHIGLYDVIEACNIIGSADATIKDPLISPIREFVEKYPIKKIFLNGRKAYDLFIKYFPDLAFMASLLPSTSSANASWTLEKLIKAWSVILEK